MRICCCYLVLDLLDYASRHASTHNRVLYAPELVPVLARRQLAARAGSALVYLVSTYCIITSLWNVCAVVAVGIARADVQHWRLPFCDVRDAYSIRRFWR